MFEDQAEKYKYRVGIIMSSMSPSISTTFVTNIRSAIQESPILATNNLSLVFRWKMGRITGSTLNDDSPNGVSGNIVGATSGTEEVTADAFLDFAAASDRVDPISGILGGLTNYECVVVLKNEDAADGGIFEYNWGAVQAGSCILLNEPASTRVRFLYRDAALDSFPAVSTSALAVGTKTVLFFGKDANDVFLEFGGTRFTAAATTATTAAGGASTLGNRDTSASTFGGKVYDLAVYDRNLSDQERLAWVNSI